MTAVRDAPRAPTAGLPGVIERMRLGAGPPGTGTAVEHEPSHRRPHRPATLGHRVARLRSGAPARKCHGGKGGCPHRALLSLGPAPLAT